VKLIAKHQDGSKRLRGNAALIPVLMEIVQCYHEDPTAWKVCKRSYRYWQLALAHVKKLSRFILAERWPAMKYMYRHEWQKQSMVCILVPVW
jgi:hypothetical protein